MRRRKEYYKGYIIEREEQTGEITEIKWTVDEERRTTSSTRWDAFWLGSKLQTLETTAEITEMGNSNRLLRVWRTCFSSFILLVLFQYFCLFSFRPLTEPLCNTTLFLYPFNFPEECSLNYFCGAEDGKSEEHRSVSSIIMAHSFVPIMMKQDGPL